jgi:iron complex transport system ATP-binding protein
LKDLAVALRNVSFAYDARPALTDVTLEIAVGEFVAIVGQNSSGKSTLLKTISGVLPVQSGATYLLGKKQSDWELRARAQRVAMVSSEEYFAFPFTVREVVAMGRTPFTNWFGRERAEDREAIQAAMDSADVSRLAERVVSELSSGERQRVLLARALAQEPQILLLDEPTAHLDVGHEWDLFDLLARLHRERSLTVICALHDLTLAARYAGRAILMGQGRVIADGKPEQVFTAAALSAAFQTPLSVTWSGTEEKVLVLTPSSKGKLS